MYKSEGSIWEYTVQTLMLQCKPNIHEDNVVLEKEIKKKKIAAREFRVWSPTTLLSLLAA